MHTLALAVTAVALVTTQAVALTGREVLTQAEQQHGFSTWKDRKARAAMDTYDKGSMVRTREMEITEQTDPRGEHRTFISFTAPADVKGTRFLHLSPRGERDQQWLWAPTTRRTRRIAEGQRDENFFGADLSYRDLELMVRIQQWNDDEATATLAGEETVDGKVCHVVELVPKNEEFAYTKYRLWFGTDDLYLWRMDVYEDADKVVKRVVPKRYQRFGSYDMAVESEVSNLPADTRTVFKITDVKYDEGVSESMFTVGNLDRG
ncbi:MAG: outer membrane lipoprotein-sorting protein [bacterium]|nr:outer membrane lipoprotein-sorting protein [bacterium]